MVEADAPRGRGRPPISAEQRAEVQLRVSRAAVGLFIDQGVARTTAEQIAAATQISTRTFWRLFATKEDSIRPLVSHGILGVVELLASWPPGVSLAQHHAHVAGRQQAEELVSPVMFGLVRLLHTEPTLHATWLSAHQEAEASWAEVFAVRLDEPPGSLQVLLYAALLNAALRAAIDSVIVTTTGDPDLHAVGTAVGHAVQVALRQMPF